MNAQRFAAWIDRHGADLEHWPPRRRAQAVRWLAASAEARATLAEARALDALLAQAAWPAAPDIAAIVAHATAEAQIRPAAPAWAAPRFGWMLGGWRAAGLAACLGLGLTVGLLNPIAHHSSSWLYDMVDNGAILGDFDE